MPAPVTCEELLDLIRRSGVVEDVKLRSHIQKLTAAASIPPDPQKLAGILVRDGILTYFQAEQILQGKYKRFSLGKYKVLEKLGAGGMAQVFLCEHKLMRRRVAIKVLPVPKADDPSSLARFYREARAIAAVDHPNIVRAYDIDQDENLHFLVMEYVDGTNLQELIKKFGPLDCIRACHYIYGAAVGLQHAHELGLVHRDIKPGNILIDRTGVVKILDMGLARFFHDEEDNLTRMNDENVLGTADYLAPEQALDSHTVDIRADIYSLGATFYYLLTGSAPFPEGSVAQKLIWHQNRDPRPILSLRPDAPEALVQIIDRMMAKDPAKRYQTPSEVMAALAGWVVNPIPPPAERELPQLSRAAGGGTGRSNLPGVSASPTITGVPRQVAQVEPNAPTVVARTPQPPGIVPGTTAPQPDVMVAAAPVWESLETDTQTVAQGDTGRPAAANKISERLQRTHAAPDMTRTVLYVVAGVMLVAAIIAGVYFAFFNTRTGPPEPPSAPGHQPITVSKAGGENAVSTLREALSRAMPGDTILIRDARLVEPKLTLDPKKHQNLTIESATADGKPAVIELSGGTIMLDATNVEGFRIRNIDFDGMGKAESGIQVSGICPGALLQGVTVRNVKAAGVRLLNATGSPGRPILIDRVRVQLVPAADGVQLTAAANIESRYVTIRGGRFEGPGRAGIRIDGAVVDLDITGNRFFGNDAAVTFPKLSEGKPLKVVVGNNTICRDKVGFNFEFLPSEQRGKLDVVLNQNYFSQTPALANVVLPPVPVVPGMPPMPRGRVAVAGVNSADNAYDPTCGQGTCEMNATELTTPLLPAPDPNNDATFLRFPGGPPDVAAGKKVGAT